MPSSEDALARSNKLLRKQHEALVKALHAITEERAMGNTQCDHINDDNKSYECNTYYKKIVKCDICQDDNAGAVDNSEINDAIRKRGTMAEKDVAAMPREHTHGGSGRYGRPRAARETAVGPRRYYLKETAVGSRRHHRDGQEKAVGAEPCDEYCESR